MASPNMRPGLAPDPQILMQMYFGHAPGHVLSAALRLDVFSHIANGHHTALEVARAAKASERGTRMLLDALAAIELLSKAGGLYDLTPMSAEYLLRDRPNYIGSALETDDLAREWASLDEAVRTGEPVKRFTDQQAAEEFFPKLVRTLHVMNSGPARRLASALGAGEARRGLKVLDIACGSGIWGIAIAEADPKARVTAQDYPGMLDITREYARRHGVETRFEYLPGDLKAVDPGEARFDVALLGNIVHSEGERASRDLLARLHRALVPGGRVAIIDMIPNSDRTAPAFPVFFALQMVLHAPEGDTYTFDEYREWLGATGYGRVETADIGSHSPAIIATRP